MDSYDIVAEAVRKYWREHYPQEVIAFFYQKYERDTEWEWREELIECGGSTDYKSVTFVNDFCEGQTCVKSIDIVSLEEVTHYYARNIIQKGCD